jgi:RecG-like helicase
VGLRRFFARVSEKDEAGLLTTIETWASSVPDTERIGAAPLRTPVRLAGIVRRISVLPIEGIQSLEATLTDGTGEVSVVFMGRRNIQGLSLGTRVIVQGVIGVQRGTKRIVNPKLEFAG